MSDVSQLSDDELIAQFKAAQQAQSQAAMTHSGHSSGGPQFFEHDPTEGMSLAERMAAGTGRFMVHGARSLGNAVGIVPDSTMATEKDIDAPLLQTGGGQAGNLIGEAALTAPLGMGVGALASRALPALAGPISQGMIQGATQGFATADPGERWANTLLGGVAGGALPGVSAAAKKLIYGLKRTTSAQALLDAGIDLTPGQMNPHGLMNQLEQSAESLGVVKQLVHPARDAAEAQWHARLIQEGAAPGTTITPSSDLSEMLRQASASYDPLYDSARGYPAMLKIMNNPGPDVPLTKAFGQAARLPGTTAPVQQKEGAWLQNQLQATVNQAKQDGGLTSDHLIDLRSTIRDRARTYNLKNDSASEEIAAIQKKAAGHVTAALNSQLPREPLANLQIADQNYGKYKVMEDAVARVKDRPAGLTPSTVSSAIADATPSAGYAKGQMGNLGPLRDLTAAGSDVFQNVSPPTGARLATLGGGAGLIAGAPHIGIPAAVGALGLTATQGGRRFAQGATKAQRLAQALGDNTVGAIPAPARGAAARLANGLSTGAALPYIPAAALVSGAILRPDWAGKKQ